MRTPALPAFVQRAERTHHRLIGAALFRIVLGVAGLEFYLSSYTERHLIWGPDGYLPHQGFHRLVQVADWSLYGLSGSAGFFELLFHLGLVTALAYTVLGGRLLTAAHFVLLSSLFLRNPQALDHAHLLARILLPLSIALVTDAYFSPLARRRRTLLRRGEGRASTVSATLHNCALFLMIFQVCVVYLMAGLWKALNPLWRDGTAMYYTVHVALTDTGPVAALVSWWPVTAFLTYGTVAIEIAFPLLVASRHHWVRTATLLAALCLHVGIAVILPLLNFSLVMIACDMLILRDDDYRKLGGRAARLKRRASSAEAVVLPQAPR
ncbi:hypothetical protein ACQEU3_43205 [Spirillospora sp. CA-253888]